MGIEAAQWIDMEQEENDVCMHEQAKKRVPGMKLSQAARTGCGLPGTPV